MKAAILLIPILLAACGAETAGTAATAAAVKKQEIEQGKQTLGMVNQKLDQSNQLIQQQADQAASEAAAQ